MNRTFTSAQSKFIPQGEPIVKTSLPSPARQAASAPWLRALWRGQATSFTELLSPLIDRTPTAHVHDRSAYPMSVAVEEVDDI
jgi:hypothetical protein